MLNCLEKMNSKNQAFLEMVYVKESSNLIGQKIFGLKLKNQAVELLEMNESICCFQGSLPICKESAS